MRIFSCRFFSQKEHRGFTLLEILISTVILAIVSLSTYTVFQNFSSSGARTQDKIVASDIISSTFEQIRRGVEKDPDSFNTLASTGWADVSVLNYPNAPAFFQRRVTYNPNTPSPNITQVVVETQWKDAKGILRQANNVFSLSRPSSYAYGNIVGQVYDCTGYPDNPCVPMDTSKVTRVSINQAPPESNWIVGMYTDAQPGGGYDFSRNQGRNILPVGNGYILQATREGFMPAIAPVSGSIDLPDAPDQVMDINMYPDKASITGRLIRTDTNAGIADKYLSLSRGGGSNWRSVATGSQGSFTFNFETNPSDPFFALSSGQTRCFTLATGRKDGELYYPYYHKYDKEGFWGHFCSNNYRQGWSSAVMGNIPSAPMCDNTKPWFGDASTDINEEADPEAAQRGICVKLGDNINLGDIPLAPLPPDSILTVNVKTTDVNLNTEKPVVLEVGWPYSGGASYRALATNDTPAVLTGVHPNFSATFEVPSVYLFLPNHFMAVKAKAVEKVSGCCGFDDQDVGVYSSAQNAPVTGPVNGPVTLTINPASDVLCGNAWGKITDLETLAPLTGGAVIWSSAQSYSKATVGNQWTFECCACGGIEPPNPEMGVIRRGTYNIKAESLGYYTRSSCASCSWPHKPTGAMMVINAIPNFTRFPSPSSDGYNLGLYRQRFGGITGQIIDQNGAAVASATITFYKYSGSGGQSITITSSDEGHFTFPLGAVIESWPPMHQDGSIIPYPTDVMVSDVAKHKIKIKAKNIEGVEKTVEIIDIIVTRDEMTNIGVVQIDFGGDA